MDNKMNAALRYAESGYAVFPCEPNGKKPYSRLVPHGVKEATTDPEVIRKWWESDPEANIGIATGASGVIVVDLDKKGDKDGLVDFVAILDEQDHNAKMVVRTPSGGLHYYYRATQEVFKASAGLGDSGGIDIRSGNTYILAPESVIDGTLYQLETELVTPAELLPLPELFETWLREQQTPKPATQEMTSEIVHTTTTGTPSNLRDRVYRYLDAADPAIQGQNGSGTTYRVLSNTYHGFNLTEPQLRDTAKYYNRKCNPPWSDGELDHKVHDVIEKSVPPNGKVRGELLTEVKGYGTDVVNGVDMSGLMEKIRNMPTCLYNLHELDNPERSGERVFFCESEKTADRLSAIGFLATACGSSGNWNPTYAGWFRNRNVAIFFGDDKLGCERARQIITDIFPVVGSVAVVNHIPAYIAVLERLKSASEAESLESDNSLLADRAEILSRRYPFHSDSGVDISDYLDALKVARSPDADWGESEERVEVASLLKADDTVGIPSVDLSALKNTVPFLFAYEPTETDCIQTVSITAEGVDIAEEDCSDIPNADKFPITEESRQFLSQKRPENSRRPIPGGCIPRISGAVYRSCFQIA